MKPRIICTNRMEMKTRSRRRKARLNFVCSVVGPE
jgi:hypothetical protein